MEFNSSSQPTVGVEWELQLLDSKTLDLHDGIMPLMTFFPDTEFVKPEYIQPCVELTSSVSQTSEESVEHIRQSLFKIQQRCAELDMSICGAGTHPFCKQLALITPLPRYIQMEKQVGYLAHQQITFSTHVHIGMNSGDQAIRAASYLTPTLPAFIAMSANSPFWRDHLTGHAAYRHRILAASPSYGLPTMFRDWKDFNRFHRAAIRSGMIKSFKDIHWDIRPHPDFGTIEIRVMDAASDLQTLHALVTFARVMAVSMARLCSQEVSRVIPLDLPRWIMKENCYRASHSGINADFIYNQCGQHRPLRGLIEELFSFCKPVAANIGEKHSLVKSKKILLSQSSYIRQLKSFEEKQSTFDVTKQLVNELANSN